MKLFTSPSLRNAGDKGVIAARTCPRCPAAARTSPQHAAEYWPKPVVGSARQWALFHPSYLVTVSPYRSTQAMVSLWLQSSWVLVIQIQTCPSHHSSVYFCFQLLACPPSRHIFTNIKCPNSLRWPLVSYSCNLHRSTGFSLMIADKTVTGDDSSSLAAHFHTSLESLERLDERTGSVSKVWAPMTAQLRGQCDLQKPAHRAAHPCVTLNKPQISPFATLFLDDGPQIQIHGWME